MNEDHAQDIKKDENINLLRYDLDTREEQTSEGGVPLEDDFIVKDNFKLEKEKIKRRRSSFGKYLSDRKAAICPDEHSTEKENVASSSNRMEIDNITTDLINDTGSLNKEQDLPIVSKNIMDPEIKLYEQKTSQLKTEYSKWKNLLKTRKKKIVDAARDYKEAKQGYTLIEEEVISSQHKKELKAILLSQPDYNQYLKQVKFAYEQVVLTEAEVNRTSLICQNFNNVADMVSHNSCKILEEKEFGTKRDPRDVLREFQNQ